MNGAADPESTDPASPPADTNAAAAAAAAARQQQDTTATPPPTDGKDAPPAPPKKQPPKKRRKPKHTGYYELLEVGFDADADDLKRAYRQLALKHHPDRRGGDQQKFIEMKRAYDVLRDDKLRELYDSRGPAYVAAFEKGDSTATLKMDLKENLLLRLLIVLVMLVPVGLMLSTPILISVRWDGASWSWAWTLFPVWMVQGFGFLCAWLPAKLASVPPPGGSGDGDGDDDGEDAADPNAPPQDPTTNTPPQERAQNARAKLLRKRRAKETRSDRCARFADVWVHSLVFALVVIFEAFIVARLDGTVRWSWFGVFAPLYAADAILVAFRFWDAHRQATIVGARMRMLLAASEAAAQLDAAERGGEVSPEIQQQLDDLRAEIASLRVSRVYLVQASFWPIIRVATELAMAAKADDRFPGTWYLTAIPLIVGCAVWAFLDSAESLARGEVLGFIVSAVVALLSQSALWLLIWLLAMAKLDNGQVFSAFAVTGPLYVVAGLVFLSSCALVTCAPDAMFDAPEQWVNAGKKKGEEAASGPEAGPNGDGAASAAGAAEAEAGGVVEVQLDEIAIQDNGDGTVTATASTTTAKAAAIPLGYVPPEDRSAAPISLGYVPPEQRGDAAPAPSEPAASTAAEPEPESAVAAAAEPTKEDASLALT